MRFRAVFALLAGLASMLSTTFPAAAEPVRPEDAEALSACLGTNQLPSERRHCIGLLSDACMAKPDGQTTIGMDMCYGRERDAWDQRLNEAYARAMKAFSPDKKAYLRDTQTQWIKFRDASCQWPEKVYEGGTIAVPLGGACLRDETANRALTLMEIDESLEPN